MALERRADGMDPARAESVGHADRSQELRPAAEPGVLAEGTLACPACDAPVRPAAALRVGEPLACPVCAHRGTVRDFLSLAVPTRAAHVLVRLHGAELQVREPRRRAR